MNILYRLTWRQMLLQKRRTLITILGVIVSVAMIAAVSSFAASFMDVFRRVEVASGGDWHAQFSEMPRAAYEKLASGTPDATVFSVTKSEPIALSSRRGRFDYVLLQKLSAEAFERMQVHVQTGRLPESTGECVISGDYAQAAALNIGDRIGETGDTVVGIAQMDCMEPSFVDTAAILTVEDGTSPTLGAYVRFDRPDASIYDWLDETMRTAGSPEGWTHESLLFYSGVGGDNALMTTIWLAAGFFMVIILVAAVSLIYNAFAISVTDRAAQFGMLASVGATPAQRRKSVLFEALTVGAVAIPFGLFFGYLGIGVTFKIVSRMLASMLTTQESLKLVVVPGAILLSVGLALVTVLVSAWIPARRAARMTPMEAINRTRDVRLTARRVRTSKLTRLLFGFEGELALKNLKRNRKRYRITQISLVISLVLFLSTCSLTDYLRASYEMSAADADCDVYVQVFAPKPASDVPRDFEVLRDANAEIAAALEGEEWTRIARPYGGVTLPDGALRFTDAMRALSGTQAGGLNVSVYAVDGGSLRAYADRVGVEFATLNDPGNPAGILINRFVFVNGHNFTECAVVDARAGETWQMQLEGIDAMDVERGSVASVEIAAVTDEFLPGLSTKQWNGPGVYLVLSETVFDEIWKGLGRSYQFVVSTDAPDAVAERLDILAAGTSGAAAAAETTVVNVTDLYKANMRVLTIINIFVYGFLALLSMVGIANVVGTVSTSLMLRKRELAMIKSVGITPRGFNRMIRYESLLYGLKAVLYGIPLSYLCMYGIWRTLGRNFQMPFQPMLAQVAIGVAAVFVVVFLTMTYSAHKIRRDSIIDGLRMENI